MAYQITLETSDGFLCERGDFGKKSVAICTARAMAAGTNLPNALRYLVENDGLVIETFVVAHPQERTT